MLTSILTINYIFLTLCWIYCYKKLRFWKTPKKQKNKNTEQGAKRYFGLSRRSGLFSAHLNIFFQDMCLTVNILDLIQNMWLSVNFQHLLSTSVSYREHLRSHSKHVAFREHLNIFFQHMCLTVNILASSFKTSILP